MLLHFLATFLAMVLFCCIVDQNPSKNSKKHSQNDVDLDGVQGEEARDIGQHRRLVSHVGRVHLEKQKSGLKR